MKSYIGLYKVIFSLLISLCYSTSISCQILGLIYQDESGRNISFLNYNDKLNSGLFYTTTTNHNNSLIKGLKFKEVYGQLELSEKKQLNKLYLKRYKIDSTKTWLIHYIDSLPNIDKMPEITGFYLYNEFENKLEQKIESKRFYHFAEDSLLVSYKWYPGYFKRIALNYNDYKKISNQESKKYGKFKSVELIHFYSINKGYPVEEIKKERLFLDKDLVFRRIFNSKLDDNYHIMIIYPNGKYYKVYSREVFIEKERKILKYKSFIRLEKVWKNKLSKK